MQLLVHEIRKPEQEKERKKKKNRKEKETKGTNVRLVRFHDEINGMDLLKLTKLIYLHEVRFLVSRPSTGNSLFLPRR